MMRRATSPTALLLLLTACSSSWTRLSHAFSVLGPWSPPHIDNIFGTGGGRAAEEPDRLLLLQEDAKWEPTPASDSEARLIVLQITDVYCLSQMAHFKTLLEETRAKARGAKVICMLTGDFLSP